MCYQSIEALFALCFFSVSCGPPGPAADSASKKNEKAAESAYSQVARAMSARAAALERGDAEAVLSAYTDDAVWIPAHSSAIVGKELARHRLKASLDSVTMREVTRTDEHVLLAPDSLLDRGVYSVLLTDKTTGSQMQEVGNYLSVWRLTSGQWKIAWQVWTSERTQQPEPAKSGGK